VTLDGRRFALVTHDDVGPFLRQIGDLRRRAMQLVLLGLLVGVPVFYLLGGRSLAQHHRRALDDARRDPLTDIGSHRIFDEQMQRAVDHALLADEYLALAVVDVDDFKIVNDRHGHRRGDAVLREVAARLQQLGGPRGMAFRTGGDEFAVVLPGHDARDAWAVLEGVRRAVEAESLGVTISAGVADLRFGVRDVELLHEHADLAAYEAKRRGRNQVVSFDRIGAQAVALDTAWTRRAA
jgi:diguanylate cyclase (GGDEF)-like protein